jgi:nucleotide-binding universal stress UspA family protein
MSLGGLGAKVLVATDLSEAADEAIRQGFARARLEKGEVIVCHVVPDVLRDSPLFPQAATLDTARQLELQTRAAAAVEDRAIAVTGAKSGEFRVVVESGTPEAVIVRIAEEVHASLVVVASRGITGIDRILLGSVAARVVRYAHGPVLVARQHAANGAILAATDFSDPALPAVTAAAEEARARSGRLTLLHAVDLLPPREIGWGAPFGASWVVPPKEMMDDVKKSAEEALSAELQRFGVAGEARAVIGNATTAILSAAREVDAELVVVATRGRTGLKRMVLGSVAEAIVEKAPCSVLAVRQRSAAERSKVEPSQER